MPIYNFKPEFAEAVATGQKCQTIRPQRKRPTQRGQKLYFYTGLRTTQCQKLGEGTCTAVRDIEIMPYGIAVEGAELDWEEANAMAQADGFEDLLELLCFFRDMYGELPFKGVLIEWELNQRVEVT